MSDDLHARLKAVIEERLALAKAATPGPWEIGNGEAWWISASEQTVVEMVGWEAERTTEPNSAFIAAHDPAAMIRLHEAALSVLDWAVKALVVTVTDGYNLDAATPMLILADAYGVPIEVSP